jgi:hypothetical protein
MPALYRAASIDEWRKPNFCALSDECKLLAQYARTGPQTNRIGLMHFSLALAAEDLEWSPEHLGERFKIVVDTLGWGWDSAARVLFIPDWFAVNRPANPNIFKKCLEDLRPLPQTELLKRFCEIKIWLPPNFSKLLPNVSANVPTNISANVTPNYPAQEQNQEQEQKPSPPAPSRQTSPDGGRWGEVVGALVATGMADVRGAITGAEASGKTQAMRYDAGAPQEEPLNEHQRALLEFTELLEKETPAPARQMAAAASPLASPGEKAKRRVDVFVAAKKAKGAARSEPGIGR